MDRGRPVSCPRSPRMRSDGPYGIFRWAQRGRAMVEIQCSSCHTRYRIDERVLPDETPTFKCSRCGHVFSVEPRKPKTDEAPATPKATEPKPAPRRTRTLPIAEPRASAESEARESSPRSSEPRARRALKIV